MKLLISVLLVLKIIETQGQDQNELIKHAVKVSTIILHVKITKFTLGNHYSTDYFEEIATATVIKSYTQSLDTIFINHSIEISYILFRHSDPEDIIKYREYHFSDKKIKYKRYTEPRPFLKNREYIVFLTQEANGRKFESNMPFYMLIDKHIGIKEYNIFINSLIKELVWYKK